ncbi:DEKNAAC102232 [Brettanomyces naardenensis]|uniref:DEKNAAC102232 n=1 Tax=Brettanomyces naardenensis TaxID=13370 RepID=A0A448YKG6_BRENA|nr:DEKNAAC102232 [Brettanomyces naardenensis]
MRLRIAAVQLSPVIGQVEENARRAARILDKVFSSSRVKSPDLIILPELAITGYNFQSRAHIIPYLETIGGGRSYQLGRELSTKYQCHTLLGYPERYPINESGAFKIYNSAVLISPTGSVIYNYRKSFLYETDEQWGCEESPDGFQSFDLNINGRRLKSTIGICMDLNPYKFKAPFDEYEFATFCYENDVDLVLVPTAWLNSKWSEDWTDTDVKEYSKLYSEEEPVEVNVDPAQNDILMTPDTDEQFRRGSPDKKTGRYWVLRMNPLYTNPHPGKRKLVVICNRSGMEDKMMYAGTTSIMRFDGGPSHTSEATGEMFIDFNMYGSMGQGNEGVLVRDVDT